MYVPHMFLWGSITVKYIFFLLQTIHFITNVNIVYFMKQFPICNSVKSMTGIELVFFDLILASLFL